MNWAIINKENLKYHLKYYSLGKDEYWYLAEKLFKELKDGEIYAYPVGHINQAYQLVRLSISAIKEDKRTITDKNADKYAHVAYDRKMRKTVFEWVRDFLINNLD